MKTPDWTVTKLIPGAWLAAACAGTLCPIPLAAQTAPPATGVLTLEQALDQAVAASPALKASAAQLQAQRERYRGAWADAGPRVTLGYQDVRFGEKQTMQLGPQTVVLRGDEVRTGSVTVAQPVTGLYGLVEKAHFEGAQEDLRQANYDIAKRDTVFRTAELYVRAQAAQKLVEVAAESVKAAESQANDADALFRAGRINQGDQLRIKLALSEAQSRLAQAVATRETVFAGLAESIQAGSPAGLAIEEFDHTRVAKDFPLPKPEEAISASRATNLERTQADIQREISTYGRKLATAQFLPSINLFAKVERDFKAPVKSKQDTRSYGVQATWDIWSNGSTVFSYREAGQQVVAAEAALQGVDQKLRIDLYQAIATAQAQKSTLDLAETAVRQAEEAYRIEKARFASGRSLATDLVLAEASLTNARGRLVTAYTEYQVTYFQLLKLQGRPFQRLASK